ncbi:MAG: hypothetical protein LBU60_04140 [Clostridiales bacterium]|jgi:hypothetical protein|nr:hypothetical protein [Clostridiales bacterium]
MNTKKEMVSDIELLRVIKKQIKQLNDLLESDDIALDKDILLLATHLYTSLDLANSRFAKRLDNIFVDDN